MDKAASNPSQTAQDGKSLLAVTPAANSTPSNPVPAVGQKNEAPPTDHGPAAIITITSAQPSPSPAASADDHVLWQTLPSLLWIIMAAAVLIGFRKSFGALLAGLATRVKSGSPVKLGQFELGSIPAPAESQNVPGAAGNASTPVAEAMKKSRDEVERAMRGARLVHRVFRSTGPGELYQVVIYLVPHGSASLIAVSRVDYFFGRQSNNLVTQSIDRARGFAIRTAASHPFLCYAEVYFNDGEISKLSRYIDFEMGDVAAFAKT